ncbi:phosphonatase-like hydrolase [Rhodococcus qingshengii]|jgi:phosphoglycolate phosphatase|uniref:Phosphonatase-like hydrolase n=1 Tax=Rhodococcus qingshengii JCM 15477 TaxID=1303681 RepID=A0AB38RJ67_RHOSG|nr:MULTISPECIES: phosphonatase-like hydrolase [Rhodococcus]MBQ7806988.1 phosphonatase-like hydrolase [Rhodococcus sp. (in: high G+C Gram-positive bacteria)]MBW0290643.1 haloacid dehalogenase [Rhodococcus sp. MH15]QXC45238.1 phosphonatase-like hydrolase [Rhodococcus qingshengii]UPU45375.1 phosphonatase-like hydrolase [Rhodococcus qingshengii JCM 15477]WCT04990.1 phosphonatase-like hydrolase [Rhodococcus qingshengii]
MSPITLAVLDMAGTTVADDGLVLRAFAAAAEAGGLPAEGPEADAARQYVLDTMGQSKIVVFRAIFGDEDRAQAANAAFETTYDSLIDQGLAEPIPGAEKAITTLREAGIKVALTTGFSRSTQDKLLVALGWETLADLTLSPAEAGRGRPHPDLILAALLKLSIDDVHQIAVLGDTSNDVLSGIRSGASIVAGTLTGAHDEQQLRDAGATHIVPSVTEFAELLTHS